MQTPDYNGFYTDIRVVGCVADESPLRLVNGRYQMDFEDLDRLNPIAGAIADAGIVDENDVCCVTPIVTGETRRTSA